MENITIKEIAESLGLIAGIITALGIISSYFMKKLKVRINEDLQKALNPIHEEIAKINQIDEEKFKMHSKAMQCSLRNDILVVYTMRNKEKKIPFVEKQAINYSFETYKALGGNSFVEDLVNDINTWEVIN